MWRKKGRVNLLMDWKVVECFFLFIFFLPFIYSIFFLAIYLFNCLFEYISDRFFYLPIFKICFFCPSIYFSICLRFETIFLFIDPWPQVSSSMCHKKYICTHPFQIPHTCHHFWKCYKNLTFSPFFSGCTIHHHPPRKMASERPKCLRDHLFSTLLTSKCASRNNAIHFQKTSETASF